MGSETVASSSSLLDQVLLSKDRPSSDTLLNPTNDTPHTLPDGSIIYDSTIAAVNRILSLNPHLHKRPSGVSSHPYDLYNSHTPVNLTDKRTFLSLLKADWLPQTPFQAVLCAKLVEEYAPTLSRDCIAITDSLLWDTRTATLRSISPDDPIATVS